MNKKNEKVYASWVIWTNERLIACNIVNKAYQIGFGGGIHRENECCGEVPVDMYKINVYGTVDGQRLKALEEYIKNQDSICNFTKKR